MGFLGEGTGIISIYRKIKSEMSLIIRRNDDKEVYAVDLHPFNCNE